MDIIICPPATLIAAFVAAARGSGVKIGGQTCHVEAKGAYTGDISAEMLADLGAEAVICGHSERRAAYGESEAQIRAQAEAAQAAGLLPIICVGESARQRERGETFSTLTRQVEGALPKSGDFALAYEPIWAIGTGQAAALADIAAAHRHILTYVDKPVLYGGSVNGENAGDIAALDEVGGLLIGTAALKAQSFLSIISACRPYC